MAFVLPIILVLLTGCGDFSIDHLWSPGSNHPTSGQVLSLESKADGSGAKVTSVVMNITDEVQVFAVLRDSQGNFVSLADDSTWASQNSKGLLRTKSASKGAAEYIATQAGVDKLAVEYQGQTVNADLQIEAPAVPHVSITNLGSEILSGPQASHVLLKILFSEDVTGFVVSDLVTSNGSLANFTSVSASEYTVEISAVADGAVTIQLPAAQVSSVANATQNEASNVYSFTFDGTAPVVTGLANDATAKKSKTWTWGCSKTCTYRYVVDTNATTSPSGSYGSVTTANQSLGDGTYYLHVQAKDLAGNVSAVVHVSAVIDNTPPSVPSGLSLVTPSSSPGNSATPTIRISGVANGLSVGLFTNSNCSNQVGTASATGATVDISATTLSDGSYQFYTRATDAAGNASACSSATVTYAYDNSLPVNLCATGVEINNGCWFKATATSQSCDTVCSTREGVVLSEYNDMMSTLNKCRSIITSYHGTTIGGSNNSSGSGTAGGCGTNTGTNSVYYTPTPDTSYSTWVSGKDAYRMCPCLDGRAPAAPTALTLAVPQTSPGNRSRPSILVSGVDKDYTVNLYTNSSCTVQVGTATASSATVEVISDALASGSYQFYARSTVNGKNSGCSSASVAYQYDSGLTPSICSVGREISGGCWFKAQTGSQSCDQVCLSRGGVDSTSYAAMTTGICSTVITSFHNSSISSSSSPGSSVCGCGTNDVGNYKIWCTSRPATNTATWPNGYGSFLSMCPCMDGQ